MLFMTLNLILVYVKLIIVFIINKKMNALNVKGKVQHKTSNAAVKSHMSMIMNSKAVNYSVMNFQ